MIANPQLLITLGGNVLSFLILLTAGSYVLAQDPRRSLNLLFFFLTVASAGFAAVFVIASLLPPSTAYVAWVFNSFDVFITMAAVHFLLDAVGESKRFRWFITLTYALGVGILFGVVLFPHLFIPYVEPRLYLPTYPVAGPLFAAMLAYFLAMPLFAFIRVVTAFARTENTERRRIEYLIYMTVIGYGFGCLNFFLAFNIPVDPVFGMLYGLYLVPVAYGIVSDQLFDISLFLGRTIFYAMVIILLAVLLVAFTLLNNVLITQVPEVQIWTVPLLASFFAFIAGNYVWRKLREMDELKYQFVTIAAHKLRTPIARIRWQTATLLDKTGDSAVRDTLTQIDASTDEILTLTNKLLDTTQVKKYRDTKFEPVDLGALAKRAIERSESAIAQKKLKLTLAIPPEASRATGSAERIEPVIDILLDNAIHYTPLGGSVALTTERRGRRVIFSIKDTGIGLSLLDRQRIFTRFFRSPSAKLVDTEGIGLGLWAANNMIRSQHGSMGALSEGIGKGSTFWFSLPCAPTETPASR